MNDDLAHWQEGNDKYLAAALAWLAGTAGACGIYA